MWRWSRSGQVVAASVFLVLTALVFVIAPRLTIPLGWTLVLLAMVLGLFGPLFGFPDWLVHLAPIAIAPTVTGDGVDVQGLWWLLLAHRGDRRRGRAAHAATRTGSRGMTAMEHAGREPAEQAAAMMTAAGMPRMPARVMMALVGSPDEGYTAAELAERLGVSAAAVSGAVRYLQSIHIIHRLPHRGRPARPVRHRRRRLARGADRQHAAVRAPRRLRRPGRGREHGAPLSVARARNMSEFFRFLARRMPELLDEWDAERASG